MPDENNIKDFAGNWTGTADITGTGNAEKLQFQSGDYMESEDIDTDICGTVAIQIDKYQSGFGSITVKYKTAATQGGLGAASWNTYSAPFTSLGWVKVRLEA